MDDRENCRTLPHYKMVKTVVPMSAAARERLTFLFNGEKCLHIRCIFYIRATALMLNASHKFLRLLTS